MNDLLTTLTNARPTEVELDAAWPVEERQTLRDAIINEGTTTLRNRQSSSASRRHTRRGALLATAAAVTGFAVFPFAFDGSDAAAADLLTLADVADNAAEWEPLAPGQYLHVRLESVQRNSGLFGDGAVFDTDREQWVSWQGDKWAIDTRPSAGYSEYHFFERPENPNLESVTPQFAAALPDNPDALAAYLHDHVSGSNSHEEAMFVAITDLARSGFLPPETLSAALTVLADIDGVHTEDVVVNGRPAIEITFSQWWGGLMGKDAVVLDRATALVLQETSKDPGGTYTSDTVTIEIVEDLPRKVVAAYERYENGQRVYNNN
jgi:hypothetical protein